MNMNFVEQNLQKYQLIQDDKIYILSTSLVGQNLKLSCFEYKENIQGELGYSSIYTIDNLRRADPIFLMAKDCEDVQWILEEVILAQSVGILEGDGILDVYLYMRANGRRAKVILRLNWQSNTPPPNKLNEYQSNQDRLNSLQNRANELLNEQNALRQQLNNFFAENSNANDSRVRSRSTNQNNYQNQLNEYNITNKFNNQNNNMANISRVQVQDDDDKEIFEVPPVNDIVP